MNQTELTEQTCNDAAANTAGDPAERNRQKLRQRQSNDRSAEERKSHGAATSDRRLDRHIRFGQEHVAQHYFRDLEARPRPGLYLRRRQRRVQRLGAPSATCSKTIDYCRGAPPIHNVEFALEAGAIAKRIAPGALSKRCSWSSLESFAEVVSVSAFRRHAQPRRARAQSRDRAAYSADGRTVLAARRANTRAHA